MAVIPMVISLAFTVLAAIMDKASVAGIVIGIAYSVSLLIMILASWGKSRIEPGISGYRQHVLYAQRQ